MPCVAQPKNKKRKKETQHLNAGGPENGIGELQFPGTTIEGSSGSEPTVSEPPRETHMG